MTKYLHIMTIFTFLLFPTYVFATEATIPVAVLNFTNQAQGQIEWDWLEKGLADLLISDLSQHPQLQLVSREQMQLAILRMQHDGAIVPEWQHKISKQLKASRAVFGTYRVDDKKVVIQATILDVLKDRKVGSVAVKGSVEEILKLEKQLAAKLLRVLTGRADAKDFVDKLPVWTDSVPASKLLYKGVDHFDYGRYEEAWLHFRRALRQDANYADAKYWAARMYYYQLRYEHARTELEPFIQKYPKHPRTADAIREIVDSALQVVQTPHQAIEVYSEIRKLVSNQQIYEPSRSWLSEKATMPARIWLSAQIAEAWKYIGNHWNAWKEYYRAYNDSLADNDCKSKIERRWKEVIVDGRKLAEEFPEKVVMIGPGRQTYTLSTDFINLGFGEWPWFVAEDGWLIHGYEVTVEIPPTMSRTTSFTLFCPGSGLMVPLGLEIPSEHTAKQGSITKTIDWRRGVTALQLEIRYYEGLWDALNRATLSFLLVKEDGVGTIRIDSNVKSEKYYIGLPFENKGKAIWLGEAKPMLTNLMPGEYQFWVNHKPRPPVPTILQRISKGHLDNVVAGQETVINVQYKVSRDKRREKWSGGVFVSSEFPLYAMSPDFRVKTSLIDVWRSGKEASHSQAGRLPPSYQHFIDRTGCVKMSGGSLMTYWSIRGDLWYSVSKDNGLTWDVPYRFPNPVNSAHTERAPWITCDKDGRLCMVFMSDRNLIRRDWPYVCSSSDGISWTRPVKVCSESALGASITQNIQGKYILLLDGRKSIWMVESRDFVSWSDPTPLISSSTSTSQCLLNPRLLLWPDGTYQLFFTHVSMNRFNKEYSSRFIYNSLTTQSKDLKIWQEWRNLGGPSIKVFDYGECIYKDKLIAFRQYNKTKQGQFMPKIDSHWIIGDLNANWEISKPLEPFGFDLLACPGQVQFTADGKIMVQLQYDKAVSCHWLNSIDEIKQKHKWHVLDSEKELGKMFK